jgi:hypothetical protein
VLSLWNVSGFTRVPLVLSECPGRHSQAFQEDKGKSQLAIWVTCLDGFQPASFLLVFLT